MPNQSDPTQHETIGRVVDGSLTRGMEIKLESSISIEDINNGTYVVIQGKHNRFVAMVTDLTLGTSDQNLKFNLPDMSDPLIREIVQESLTYNSLSVRPGKVLPAVRGDHSDTTEARTIPEFFSPVFRASQNDMESIFGKEDENNFFIGHPLDMDTKICVDPRQLIKRSCGVFGRSGTGKTFLARLLMIGVLQHTEAASLIFDMHNEYGESGQDNDRGGAVSGLKTLFPGQVSIFTLDENSSKLRKARYDEVVRIGYSDIEPEDIESLTQTLNLSDVAASIPFTLKTLYGDNWFKQLVETDGQGALNNLASEVQVQPQAMRALRNRLLRLTRFDFLDENPQYNSLNRLLDKLKDGMHVVLEFGRHGNDLTAYILVANLLTRRLHNKYRELTEESDAERGTGPKPLVICIEEAHRFLAPGIASQTIFGQIAREDRKFNITLMVIDQRPSGIDSEIMSQIATRISCLLNDERDVDAVLSGSPNSRELKSVLSRLNAKQEALFFGDAIPMPILIRTRPYGDNEHYQDLTSPSWKTGGQNTDSDKDSRRDLDALFGNS